ncbi:MAG: hypothetical protein AAF599_17365, partial [Bacteroidota bacterium]
IQYGFTAQNIQEVFPMLVSADSKWYLQTSYGAYDAMHVEALRELAMQNEKLKAENESQQLEIEALKAKVDKINQLEAMLEQLKAKVEDDSDSNNTTISVER